MVTPEFALKSNALVAVKVPPPLNIIPERPTHVMVPLLADEIVDVPFDPPSINIALDDELPLQVKAFVMVVVPPWGSLNQRGPERLRFAKVLLFEMVMLGPPTVVLTTAAIVNVE